MRRISSVLFALALVLASASPALAHETRVVGPYRLIVGFLTEPAFTGIPNGVDLRVSDATTNAAVEGLQDSVQVEVHAAGQTKTYKLRARFGQPGAYAADFVPTRASQYLFRFFGKIGDRAIDERFESGPGRFNEPESIVDAQFPSGDTIGERLGTIQSALDQTRLLAVAAVILALAGLGLQAVRRRA